MVSQQEGHSHRLSASSFFISPLSSQRFSFLSLLNSHCFFSHYYNTDFISLRFSSDILFFTARFDIFIHRLSLFARFIFGWFQYFAFHLHFHFISASPDESFSLRHISVSFSLYHYWGCHYHRASHISLSHSFLSAFWFLYHIFFSYIEPLRHFSLIFSFCDFFLSSSSL